MIIDIKKAPIGALVDYQSMLECALVRAEVDEDISRYKKIKNDLDELRAEISARKVFKNGKQEQTKASNV